MKRRMRCAESILFTEGMYRWQSIREWLVPYVGPITPGRKNNSGSELHVGGRTTSLRDDQPQTDAVFRRKQAGNPRVNI